MATRLYVEDQRPHPFQGQLRLQLLRELFIRAQDRGHQIPSILQPDGKATEARVPEDRGVELTPAHVSSLLSFECGHRALESAQNGDIAARPGGFHLDA